MKISRLGRSLPGVVRCLPRGECARAPRVRRLSKRMVGRRQGELAGSYALFLRGRSLAAGRRYSGRHPRNCAICPSHPSHHRRPLTHLIRSSGVT
jgi:hypothetical protein